MVLLHYTFKASQPGRVEKPLKCYSTAHSLRLQNASETERLRFPSGSPPPTAGHVCFCKLQHAFWELKALQSTHQSSQQREQPGRATQPAIPSTGPAVVPGRLPSLGDCRTSFHPPQAGQSR